MSIVVALVAGFIGSMVAGIIAYLYVTRHPRRAGAKLASMLGMSAEAYAALKDDVLTPPDPIAQVMTLRCPKCGHETVVARVHPRPEDPFRCEACGFIGRVPPHDS